MNRKKGQQPTG